MDTSGSGMLWGLISNAALKRQRISGELEGNMLEVLGTRRHQNVNKKLKEQDEYLCSIKVMCSSGTHERRMNP